MQLFEHAATQVTAGVWDVVGWWKGRTVNDDGVVTNPKCHVVSIVSKTQGPFYKLVL
jgi:hypothetical protein